MNYSFDQHLKSDLDLSEDDILLKARRGEALFSWEIEYLNRRQQQRVKKTLEKGEENLARRTEIKPGDSAAVVRDKEHTRERKKGWFSRFFSGFCNVVKKAVQVVKIVYSIYSAVKSVMDAFNTLRTSLCS